MKIAISFTLDVDPDAWDLNYGTGTDPQAVRADVRTYVENGARDHLRDLGVLREAD